MCAHTHICTEERLYIDTRDALCSEDLPHSHRPMAHKKNGFSLFPLRKSEQAAALHLLFSPLHSSFTEGSPGETTATATADRASHRRAGRVSHSPHPSPLSEQCLRCSITSGRPERDAPAAALVARPTASVNRLSDEGVAPCRALQRNHTGVARQDVPTFIAFFFFQFLFDIFS